MFPKKKETRVYNSSIFFFFGKSTHTHTYLDMEIPIYISIKRKLFVTQTWHKRNEKGTWLNGSITNKHPLSFWKKKTKMMKMENVYVQAKNSILHLIFAFYVHVCVYVCVDIIIYYTYSPFFSWHFIFFFVFCIFFHHISHVY